MSIFPKVTGKKLIRALLRFGLVRKKKQNGSHEIKLILHPQNIHHTPDQMYLSTHIFHHLAYSKLQEGINIPRKSRKAKLILGLMIPQLT